MQRLSTKYKLTLLLALLSTGPIVYLVFQKATEQMTDQAKRRMQACQQLALSCADGMQRRRSEKIQALLNDFSNHVNNLGSVRLARFDGVVIHQWGTKPDARGAESKDAFDRISIPIMRDARNWGALEASFTKDLAGERFSSVLRAFSFGFTLNLVAFGLLLRRSLAVLDSSKAVPRRVKNTLDTIAGGVVITDPKGRLMMANDAFVNTTQNSRESLIGQTLDKIPFSTRSASLPWHDVLRDGARTSGVTVELVLQNDEHKTFVVNANPVFDSQDKLAGALINFEDVTTLESQKQSLMRAMAELETSKEQIHLQNLRLQELASKDALTGSFNRRMLMERLESHWNEFLATQVPVNVVMLDVDHFKKFNDTYGHAAGDQVLKDVARVIRESVGDLGFVGRYGGEEFCVILSQMTPAQAETVAEGIRRAIQHQLADPYRVTSSFGVSSCLFGASTFQLMLEQADQALYAAKQGGRNQVKLWSSEMSTNDDAVGPVIIEKTIAVVHQPISYQAVASLHAALAFRDADTALHSQRVSELCVAIGRGLMTVSELYVLEIAGLLHDIGKIGVPDSVLLKPGKLDAEEWKIMDAHARMGEQIINSAFQSEALSEIIRYHHYRYDGGGTKDGGPTGKDIPLGARIICMVDAYDAMVSNRIYRKGRSSEEAFAELRRCAGAHFDPDLVELFDSQQIGWRPDSRYMQSDVDDSSAITVGYLTERTVSAYDAHDVKTLAESLDHLKQIAKQLGYPAIVFLADDLSKNIAGREVDWDSIVPVMQDLMEICLTIQRAHIRDVASRPNLTLDCPQESYYAKARQWDADSLLTSAKS